ECFVQHDKRHRRAATTFLARLVELFLCHVAALSGQLSTYQKRPRNTVKLPIKTADSCQKNRSRIIFLVRSAWGRPGTIRIPIKRRRFRSKTVSGCHNACPAEPCFGELVTLVGREGGQGDTRRPLSLAGRALPGCTRHP